ncbi:hypothetical protein [Shouchella patagoniensis]|uniref:hypothetical protein n=1 Tax=Shouchella patagoniensis TaxID=228576 RepID=UPI000994CDD1|nr:hypothetical protein [Shouchella patagoniensis]
MTNEGENPQQPNGEETPNDQNGNNEEPLEQDLGQAAEDEFTREFLVSTEEEEEGFYRMRGELGGFEMLIPKDALISDLLHAIENQKGETLIYTMNNDLEKKQHDVQVMYMGQYPEGTEHNYLNVFKREMGFDGDFSYTEINDLEAHYGSLEYVDDYGPVIKYFGYLFSKEKDQAISFVFGAFCQGEEECVIDLEEESKLAEKIMNSIRLK